MARPSVPRLSRSSTVTSALALIDADGIEKLSLRRLGAALGVHGMSLYHHFDDKQAILDAVAAHVLRDLRAEPPRPDESVVDWSFSNASRYRAALLRHPNAIPLFVQRLPVSHRASMYEREFEALAREGVDESCRLIIVETLEAFTLGSALFARDDERNDPEEGAARSVAFEVAYRALAEGLLERYGRSGARV